MIPYNIVPDQYEPSYADCAFQSLFLSFSFHSSCSLSFLKLALSLSLSLFLYKALVLQCSRKTPLQRDEQSEKIPSEELLWLEREEEEEEALRVRDVAEIGEALRARALSDEPTYLGWRPYRVTLLRAGERKNTRKWKATTHARAPEGGDGKQANKTSIEQRKK